MRVADESMRPVLSPGDRLWVDPYAYRRRPPRPGAVVVVRDPEQPRRLLIKRVAVVGPARLWVTRTGFRAIERSDLAPPDDALEEVVVAARELLVLSDHLRGGRDSRRFGPVTLENVIGEAWYRYAPRKRRGRLTGPPRTRSNR